MIDVFKGIGVPANEALLKNMITLRDEQILDAFVTRIGPAIYNAAVEDVKQFMLTQLEDMGAIYHKK